MKPSLLAASCLPLTAFAIKLPVRLAKRDGFGVAQPVANAASSGGQMIGLSDNQDLIYIANVTISGQSFPVQLDTGSSDLWVSMTGSNVLGSASNLTHNLTYGIGFASGPIATASVSFAGFDVPKQAYLAGTQVNNPATTYGAQGVLGLGFTSLSSIDLQVNETGGAWGRSLLFNIFAQNSSEPNFMAFALQRNDDPDQEVHGSFTIGEYDSGFAGVANTAPIPTFPETNPNRWTILIDQVIANGQKVSLKSAVNGAPSEKAVGLVDTGTSFVYAPERIVTSIYSSVPNATFSQSLGKWVVPCDTEVDVSIVIAGRQFDIHPLDTVQPTSSGSTTCVGTWIPQSLSVGKSEFDFIWGDATLRSIYVVFDFGDFDSKGQMGAPYVKLWSLITGSDASNEFHQVRGGTPNNTFLANPNVNAASANANETLAPSASSTSSSDLDDLRTKVDELMKWAPAALGLAGLNILILLVVLITTITLCLRRRRKNSKAPGSTGGGSFIPFPATSHAHEYRPVSLQSALREEESHSPHSREKKYGVGARYSD